MSKLVIAEKPMLARDIARAITGKEVSESARLPISGNGYRSVPAPGTLDWWNRIPSTQNGECLGALMYFLSRFTTGRRNRRR